MIVQGGFSSCRRFSSWQAWQAIAGQMPELLTFLLQRAHRWHPRKLFITEIFKHWLIVLFRWIHCCIVYGSEGNLDVQHVGSQYQTRLRNLLKDCDVAIPRIVTDVN